MIIRSYSKADLSQVIYCVPLEQKMKIHINSIYKMIRILQDIFNGFFSEYQILKKDARLILI